MIPKKRYSPIKASKPGNWEEGSRWLHVWPVQAPGSDRIAVAFQFEVIGVVISSAPYVLMYPTDAANLLASLEGLEESRRDEIGVSVRLDREG